MPAQTPMGWRMVLQSMPRGDVVQRIAHHQAGHAAGHFHHLDGAAHFHLGVVGGLAVLAREDGGHFVGVLVQQRLEAVEHLDAVNHGHVAPLQERLVRGANGAVDIGFGGEGVSARSCPWRDWSPVALRGLAAFPISQRCRRPLL